MEFYEAAQSQNEEEAEVDLMVQLSGLVHHDWRMEEPESPGRASRTHRGADSRRKTASGTTSAEAPHEAPGKGKKT
jgi:hypothetical protein